MSAFNIDQNDHEYFASTVETITIGRDAVTTLASQEPPHVFDILWNMDLNTALNNIKAPYIIDGNEQEHKDGANGGKMYTLGTDSFTMEIELTSTTDGSNVTSLIYTQVNGTRTGTGVDEAKCLLELAKLLSVDSTNTVTLLKDDGTEDVGSSIDPLMVASVSSAIGNSLSSQATAITNFMTTLKGAAGTYNWYYSDSDNKQSVNTQVKYGLAQLFDRDPELNNLIGSSATSSTFLDSDKIKEKMQNNLDPFYINLFSESQLVEVLEAVADKGSRINGSGDNRTFNFSAGDSITAVAKVVDSDSNNVTGNNSDRWLVTLQHLIAILVKLESAGQQYTLPRQPIKFTDSGGLDGDYKINESTDITFDGGAPGTLTMVINSCTFDHTGGLHDRLGLQVGNHLTPTWTQLGIDIDGEAAGDESGISVSLSSDGRTVAIGAKRNNGLNGSNSGHVRVYRYNDIDGWIKLGDDIDGEAANDQSGYSVSLSSDGNTVAIGAPYNDGSSTNIDYNSGHVRVYQYNDTDNEWIKLGDDIDGVPYKNQAIGRLISLSSDGTIVGIISSVGASVYQYTGIEWIKLGSNFGYYGNSIAISDDGTIVAIGHSIYHIPSHTIGRSSVFKYDGSVWTQLGVDITGEAAGDAFGKSVSLSSDGNTLAVGSPNAKNGNTRHTFGNVKVFKYTENANEWIPYGNTINGPRNTYTFGESVSLSSDGNTVAIGSSALQYSNLSNVMVFKYIDSGWTQLGINIPGELPHSNIDICVSLSSDGNTVAIGDFRNYENGIDRGHVRVYNLSQMQNADINGFFKSDISIPPYSVTPSDTSSTSGYIFPTNLLKTVYSIPYRYSRFWFTSDSDTTKAGWDITLSYFS